MISLGVLFLALVDGNFFFSSVLVCSFVSTVVVMDVQAAETEGDCKCGPTCACVNCTCGSH